MLKQQISELTGATCSGAIILYNNVKMGLTLEDLTLYLVFPVIAGGIVHLFRRVTDKYIFNKDKNGNKKDSKNDS